MEPMNKPDARTALYAFVDEALDAMPTATFEVRAVVSNHKEIGNTHPVIIMQIMLGTVEPDKVDAQPQPTPEQQ